MNPAWMFIAMAVLNLGAAVQLFHKGSYSDAWIFTCYGLSYGGFIARHFGVLS